MPRRRKASSAAKQREQMKITENSHGEKMLSPQSITQQPSHTHSFDGFKIISGTLHQGDSRFQCPGIQCAFISLVALIRMIQKDPLSWTQGHVDSCVIDGNSRFIEHCDSLGIQPKMLMANELPQIIHFPKKNFCMQSVRM